MGIYLMHPWPNLTQLEVLSNTPNDRLNRIVWRGRYFSSSSTSKLANTNYLRSTIQPFFDQSLGTIVAYTA